MSKGKVVVGGVSIILVVGVVIGVIAGVSRHDDSGSGDKIATKSKYVSAMCSQTDYQQQCADSLATAAKNQSATPKDYIQAAMNYTMQQIERAMNKSQNLGSKAKDPREQMAMEDCKELLQYSLYELESSILMVDETNTNSLANREEDLKDWLSAVMSYQDTCLDGLSQPDLKNSMSDGLANSTELTSNALAIVSGIGQLLSMFNIQTNSSSNSRKLLDSGGGKNSGEFPSWLSGADRKLLAGDISAKPNAVVAKDGSGQFKTIGEAIASYPKNPAGRFVIYVKAGIYDEYVTIVKKQVDVFMYGDGPDKTIVTGSKSFTGGVPTFKTAPFAVVGFGFICKDMGFRNTAGPEGHQAVALRVQSDRSAFFNCKMEGYQDTLYTQAHRQFYRNCVISGTIDFIFGDASAIIQNSQLVVRKPMANQRNIITAHGRIDKRENTGLVVQNCKIVAAAELEPVKLQFPSYLGRPWKAYSRTMIMESLIGDLIQPDGWMPWNGNMFLDTLSYAEYGNRGPGAPTDRRVKWKGYKVITDRNEAQQYTPGSFIQGSEWLPATGAPFYLGFTSNADMIK